MRSLLPIITAALSLFAAAQAGADIIAIGNMPYPAPFDNAKELNTTTWEAIGVTTDARPEVFSAFSGIFDGGTNGGVLEGGIYTDNGFNAPSTNELATFNPIPITAWSADQYTLTTATQCVLQPSTKYWFVLHDLEPLAWVANSSTSGSTVGTPPTPWSGFGFSGFDASTDAGGSWSADNVNYAVQISTSPINVPEPSTLALVAVAVMAGGMLLRRFRFTSRKASHPLPGA